MTIEQILECSAETLEKMTDEELLNHFAPFLPVTRPAPGTRPQRRDNEEDKIPKEKISELDLKLQALKALGINIDRRDMIKKLK